MHNQLAFHSDGRLLGRLFRKCRRDNPTPVFFVSGNALKNMGDNGQGDWEMVRRWELEESAFVAFLNEAASAFRDAK